MFAAAFCAWTRARLTKRRSAGLTLPNGAIWGYGHTGRSGRRPVLVHHGLIGDASFGPIWNELRPSQDLGLMGFRF